MKTITTDIAEISFDEKERLLHLKLIEGAEMTLENTKRHYEEIKKLTGNKKHFALIDASNYCEADIEALEYASRQEVLSNRLASAHYNSIMANKFTTHFFKVNYQPPVDVRVFDTKEEAISWLFSLKNREQ